MRETARPHQQAPAGVRLPPDANVYALFARQAAARPEQTFLIVPELGAAPFTYRAFHEQVLRAAAAIARLNLAPGDRVAIVFPNSAEFVLLYFACFALGLVVVPINRDLAAPEIGYIVRDSGARAVYFDRALEQRVNAALPSGNAAAPAPVLVPLSPWPHMEVLADEAPHALVSEARSDADAVIIYTSGTTGNPKGVVLSHLALLADSLALAEWFHFDAGTRALGMLPLFHNNGQVVTLLAPLQAGGSTVLSDSKRSLMAFWGIVAEHGVTWTSVMPSILAILLSIDRDRTDTTMQGIVCGGQILSTNLQLEFERRFGVPVFEGYGLTETTSFASMSPWPAERRTLGSVGSCLPVNEVAALDAEGNAVPAGDEGELCIRGINVAREYLGLEQQNARSFRQGWFWSGDFGHIDAEGRVWFHGRRDALIIKGGENIYPAELENALYQHGAVAECAVIGVPDPIFGEDLCAFVQLKGGAQATADELARFVSDLVADFKKPREIYLLHELGDLPEIPKGPSKKVLYRALRAYYAKRFPNVE